MGECSPFVSILAPRGEKIYMILPNNYINRRIISPKDRADNE